MLARCTISVFHGHDEHIIRYIREHRIHTQSGCFYSTVVTCHGTVVGAQLPSLVPGAPLSGLPLDWYKRKPNFEFGPDVWEKTKGNEDGSTDTQSRRAAAKNLRWS